MNSGAITQMQATPPSTSTIPKEVIQRFIDSSTSSSLSLASHHTSTPTVLNPTLGALASVSDSASAFDAIIWAAACIFCDSGKESFSFTRGMSVPYRDFGKARQVGTKSSSLHTHLHRIQRRAQPTPVLGGLSARPDAK